MANKLSDSNTVYGKQMNKQTNETKNKHSVNWT